MNTVEDNKKFLSDSQQLKAKKARKMIQALGTPTTTDLKAIIRMNLIKDCKENTEDMNLAERVYGPHISSLKGKSARTKSAPVTSNIIELPEELLSIQEDITLSINNMQVSSLKFL